MIDNATGLDAITKQPSESLVIDMPISNRMRTSDTISSVTSVESTRLSGSGTLTITNKTYSGTTVQARYAGGTDGDIYKITSIVVTTGGDTVETDAVLYIKDS